MSEISNCTENIGATLMICYSDSAYEHLISEVEANLKVNTELRQRNE